MIVCKGMLLAHSAREQLEMLTAVPPLSIMICMGNDHFFQFNSLLRAEAAQYVQADISKNQSRQTLI